MAAITLTQSDMVWAANHGLNEDQMLAFKSDIEEFKAEEREAAFKANQKEEQFIFEREYRT